MTTYTVRVWRESCPWLLECEADVHTVEASDEDHAVDAACERSIAARGWEDWDGVCAEARDSEGRVVWPGGAA